MVVGSPMMLDLSGFEKEQFSEIWSEIHPDASPGTIASWTGQLWRFVRVIKEGDIVALPLKTRSEVAFGRITGTYRYDSNAPDGARHQRPVQWMNTSVARINIDQDLRRSFGGLKTVFAVARNDAEARIESLLEGKSKSAFVSPQEGEEEDGDTVSFDMHREAEDQIIDFIGRNFKGHDFARLVAGVLTAQGYKVQTSPPGPDGGVDIVAGRGPMGFEAPRLCVQVKSGDAQVGVTVLRELQGVMKNYRAQQGLIVSWSGFKQTVYKEARQLFFEMRLWDQSALVKAIQEVYEKLPDQLQAELPLKRTWLLVGAEGA